MLCATDATLLGTPFQLDIKHKDLINQSYGTNKVEVRTVDCCSANSNSNNQNTIFQGMRIPLTLIMSTYAQVYFFLAHLGII